MTFKDAFELFGYTWWFPLIQDFCFVFPLTRQSGYLEMVGIYYLSGSVRIMRLGESGGIETIQED